jgi:hypothetical protein
MREGVDGRLEAFGTAPNNTIWHASQTTPGGPAWSSWEMLNGPGDRLVSIAAAQNADGRLEAFGIASNNTIWHASQTTPGGPAWSSCEMLSSRRYQLRSMAAEQMVDGRLEVFGTAADNTIWYTSQSSAGTWPLDPPDAPRAPTFAGVTETRVTVAMSPLPDFASELSLEELQSNGAYATLTSNMTSAYTLSGLTGSTSYTFRFVAFGPGGSTAGPPATAITSAPQSQSCPAREENLSYEGRPDCGNIADHPSAEIRCDTQGYFCCEHPRAGESANDPRCGAGDYFRYPADCMRYGPRVFLRPSGCYRSN